MNKNHNISAVIIACNEERYIKQCIESILPITNDIILIDSGSTDDTVNIAESTGAKVYHKPWQGYGANKNFGNSKAKFDWILLIKGNCTAISYQKRFSINPLVSLKIKTIVAKFKIDIIHAHDSHAHTFLYLSYRLFNLNCPSVVSRRVDFPISSSSLTKYNFTQIRKIICVSHKINEIVSANLEDNTRSVTVHSGVDLDKFNTLSSISLRKRFSIPINQRVY